MTLKDTTRRFMLYYFLNDKKMMITEITADDSKIYLPKQLLLFDDSTYIPFMPKKDLKVGQLVKIGNDQYHIIGCDEPTREWFSPEDNLQPNGVWPNTEEKVEDYARYEHDKQKYWNHL